MTDTCSRNRLFTLPLLTLILFLSAGCQPAATGLAIENVTVVDPVAGVLPQQRVVVRGDQIVSAGPDIPLGPYQCRWITNRV